MQMGLSLNIGMGVLVSLIHFIEDGMMLICISNCEILFCILFFRHVSNRIH